MSNKYIQRENMTQEQIEQRYQTQIQHLETFCASLMRMLKSVGIQADKPGMGSYVPVYTHAALHTCECGRRPKIEEAVEEESHWLVKCPNCELRTKNFPKVKDALKAWQDRQFTETSVMLKTPLTAQEMSDEGAKRLLGSIVADAAEEYVAGLRAGTGPSEDSAWFFSDSPGAQRILADRARGVRGKKLQRKANSELF